MIDRLIRRTTGLVVVLSIAGCASIQGGWQEAEQSNSPEGYQEFVDKWGNETGYPASERIQELRRMDSGWSMLKVGMSFDQVSELLDIPDEKEPPAWYERLASSTRLSEAVAATGVPTSFDYTFCGPDGDCRTITNTEDASQILRLFRTENDLHRVGRYYELEFDQNRTLKRWQKLK